MRIIEAGFTPHTFAEFLRPLAIANCLSLHSSDEYESFDVLCQSLHRLSPRIRETIRHIVKLAEPHFGSYEFSSKRVIDRIESYLDRLGSPTIDVVQWMVRGDLHDVERRRATFDTYSDKISACFSSLRDRGLIRAVALFPYDTADISASLDAPWCDGWIIYLNIDELEWISAVDLAQARDRGIIALRPFNSKRALGRMDAILRHTPTVARDSAEACIQFPLLHPAVSSVVLSPSNQAHVSGAYEAGAIAPDLRAFEDMCARVQR